jgi:hypothetical protein
VNQISDLRDTVGVEDKGAGGKGRDVGEVEGGSGGSMTLNWWPQLMQL